MPDRRSHRLFNCVRFGAAHGARSLGWSAVDMLLAWHLHVRVGLTGVHTGWLTFAFLVLGGVATFLVGFALSRLRAAGPMVVRVQLFATIATAVLLWAQFAVQDAAAAIVAGMGFRLAYAVQDVAQNMLASLLPEDEADAGDYARLRVTLSAITRCLIVTGFALTTRAGMTMLLALIGMAMVASATGLRGAVFPPRPPAEPAGSLTIPPGLPALLLQWLVVMTLLPTISRLLVFTPVVAEQPRSGAWLLGAYCVGLVIGPLLRDTIGRPLTLALVIASGAMILPPPFAIDLPWQVVGAILHGAAIAIINVRFWAATSRLAMDEARQGRSSDGLIFGCVILTIHLATAAGMLMLGPLIEGFDTGRLDAPVTAWALTAAGVAAIAWMGIGGGNARRWSAAGGGKKGARLSSRVPLLMSGRLHLNR